MNCSWKYDNYSCVDGITTNYSGNVGDNCDSYSSRMVVSDADDYDTSDVGVKDDTTSVSGEDDIKVGSSYYISPTVVSSDYDQHHRVNPLYGDSGETIARTTAKGNQNIGNTTFSFLPPLSHLTDDGKTVFTIQPRDQDSQDSSVKIVDEYKVKYDHNESTSRRHDSNTRRRISNLEDTQITRERVDKNSIAEKLLQNSPGVADCSIITSNDFTTNITNITNNTFCQQSHHQHHYLPNQKYLSSSQKNSISTMPSKVNSCLPRQRSRAIAIKRSCPGADFTETTNACGNFADKEVRRCDVELYDYATWRMYNRIIDHRRKHIMRIQHQNDLPQEQQHHHHDLKNKRSSTSNRDLTASTIEEQNTKGMVHSSSIFGQSCNVHHNMVYTCDHHLSFSDDDDEIFDFEL